MIRIFIVIILIVSFTIPSYAELIDNGTMTDLGTLGFNSQAMDMNNNGQIVGTAIDHAVLWNPFPVIPERISSIFFLRGSATLGIRGFMRTIK